MNEETINNNYTPTKKEQKLAIFITIFTIVMITGLTYTFFSAAVSNTNNEKLTTQTATMSLEFDDNDNGISANLNLGESITKKFTLENTGTVDAYGKINWYNLVNTYTEDSLTWALEQSESENGTYIMVGSGKVPVSSNNSNKPLKGNLFVPVNKTYYYKLTITLNNLDIDQSSDINASMHSQFSLSSAVETGVDKISKLALNHPVNQIDVIEGTSNYDYVQQVVSEYILKFNGFIWPAEWEYDIIEDCESDISWLEEEFGSDVEFVCQLDNSTNKYNISSNDTVSNPPNSQYLFNNQDDCEYMIDDWGFNNTTCVSNIENIQVECTNTLAYDGTVDNNLRYVGLNPCNYVTFNGESPELRVKYRMINKETYEYEEEWYTTKSACEEVHIHNYSDPNNIYECKEIMESVSGWRIIGVMNNVDDGSGNLETRIKLMRAAPLGNYSWDTSATEINSGYGINDWTQADLMQELNGDYLNTSLNANTYWYNGWNNTQTGVFDYTKKLNSSAQSLIGEAKWYLGTTRLAPDSIPSNSYTVEKGTQVWGSRSNQTCNDGYCPRALSWTGKVALIYPSDYGFATMGGQTTSRNLCINSLSLAWLSNNTSWLSNSNIDCRLNEWVSSQWSLSPESWKGNVGFVTGYDFLGEDGYYVSQTFPVHPVVYLKSNVKISGGNGSISNPYVIG